jgi:hypothetical protein
VDKFVWIPLGKSVLSVFPDSSESIISTLQNNLALVLSNLGDYKGALELSGKALRIVQKVLPAGHPYIQTVSNNYQFYKDRMK